MLNDLGPFRQPLLCFKHSRLLTVVMVGLVVVVVIIFIIVLALVSSGGVAAAAAQAARDSFEVHSRVGLPQSSEEISGGGATRTRSPLPMYTYTPYIKRICIRYM